MAFTSVITEPEPTRAEIDALPGPAVLEFGTPQCQFCRAAQPFVAAAFAGHALVHHIKVEDGSGRRLGRSFGVRLWPTLVFLRDGRELARLVRPAGEAVIVQALASLELVRK
ncbi:MAG: thioredoxin family protein [Polaromonas sp.]|uniref:thioredoxin family protein n=1 Tax=Polaromonas sp. TaxID=1869339 RepID=UPI0027375AB1|nr:thioredoxin family protein [Polaromonas sp.]MDP2820312.1 thioredoxin family protein [Polaromonas sp.]